MPVIYSIMNILNEKQYIGSAVKQNVRFNKHKSELNRNVHCNKHLQSAYNKYGKDSFKFLVIENCSEENMLEREQFYIDWLKPEYNKSPTAGSPLGVRHSEETKAKFSAWQIGRKLPEETKLRQSLASKGKAKSIEHRQKLSNSLRGKKQYRERIEKQIASRKANSSWTHPEGRKCKCEKCKERKNLLKRHWRATSEKSDQKKS